MFSRTKALGLRLKGAISKRKKGVKQKSDYKAIEKDFRLTISIGIKDYILTIL